MLAFSWSVCLLCRCLSSRYFLAASRTAATSEPLLRCTLPGRAVERRRDKLRARETCNTGSASSSFGRGGQQDAASLLLEGCYVVNLNCCSIHRIGEVHTFLLPVPTLPLIIMFTYRIYRCCSSNQGVHDDSSFNRRHVGIFSYELTSATFSTVGETPAIYPHLA